MLIKEQLLEMHGGGARFRIGANNTHDDPIEGGGGCSSHNGQNIAMKLLN